jgi:hypothetical protein
VGRCWMTGLPARHISALQGSPHVCCPTPWQQRRSSLGLRSEVHAVHAVQADMLQATRSMRAGLVPECWQPRAVARTGGKCSMPNSKAGATTSRLAVPCRHQVLRLCGPVHEPSTAFPGCCSRAASPVKQEQRITTSRIGDPTVLPHPLGSTTAHPSRVCRQFWN